jgi:hypothetical protein
MEGASFSHDMAVSLLATNNCFPPGPSDPPPSTSVTAEPPAVSLPAAPMVLDPPSAPPADRHLCLNTAELDSLEAYTNQVSAEKFDHGDARFADIVISYIKLVAINTSVHSCNDGGPSLLHRIQSLVPALAPLAPLPKATPQRDVPRVEGKAVTSKKAVRFAKQPPPHMPARKSAPAKVVEAPPTVPKAPAFPPTSSAHRRAQRRGKHTVHGASRHRIRLSPPTGSPVTAASFTPEIIADLNRLIAKDLQGDLCLTSAHAAQYAILLETTRVPSIPETAFVLKHVRRLFPTPPGESNIAEAPASSTTYLKVLDVPRIDGPPRDWVRLTRAAFQAALTSSPAGIALAKGIKHIPRIMRNSSHSDSCTAWVDIHDSVSGAAAKQLLGQFIPIGGVNCHIAGAKPHSGSVLCTRCMRWGHHFKVCRAKAARCSLCGGPHSETNHASCVAPTLVEQRSCVNCTSARKEKHNHSAKDTSCPFWKHRFDREWLKRQFSPLVTPQGGKRLGVK